jgi:hypothetical protein
MLGNDDGSLAILILIGWFISMAFAAHFGGQRNAGMTGLFLGFLFGPVGMIAAGFLDGRPNCSRCGGRQNVKPTHQRYEICEHCGIENPAPAISATTDALGIFVTPRQRKFAWSAVLSTLLAPMILASFVPTRFGSFQLPGVAVFFILAGIWFAVFKLIDMAWDHFTDQQPTTSSNS